MARQTLAIVGAGPQIGMAMARRFGKAGYRIGLISRSRPKLDGYVRELDRLGIEAAAFPADVMDRPRLTAALDGIKGRFGSIDVLEYSPLIEMTGLVDVLGLSVAEAQKHLEFQLFGAITAVQAVVHEMIARGSGAILITTGVTAYVPAPSHANGAVAVVALREYAQMLHLALRDRGVYVGTISMGRLHDPDDIAGMYWDMLQRRQGCERFYGDPRILLIYEEMVTRGLCGAYPPALLRPLPVPKDHRERDLFLIALHHISTFLRLQASNLGEADRLTQLAVGLGGDRSAAHFGADIDAVYAPVQRLLPADAD